MHIAVARCWWSKYSFIKLVILLSLFCSSFAESTSQQLREGSQTQEESKKQLVDLPEWQIGGFAAGGYPPFYKVHRKFSYGEELEFYNTTLEAGRMLTGIHGRGFLRGRGESVIEVTPFWLAYAPKQVDLVSDPFSPSPFPNEFQAYSQHGISITPFLLRWNFLQSSSSRLVPWAQAGGGLLWTAHNFPRGEGGFPPLPTSRINFTPQVDFGENIFVKKNQSINLGVRAVHISSADLGIYNPGINVLVEFTAGYSWWK